MAGLTKSSAPHTPQYGAPDRQTPVHSGREPAAMEEERESDRIDLLQRARRGDSGALNALLKSMRPGIRNYLVGQLQSSPSTSAQADELTQTTLLRVARSIGSCQAGSEGELWSWVRTTARRVLIDRYRQRKPEHDRRVWTPEDSVVARATVEELFGESAEDDSDEESADPTTVLGRILLEAQDELTPGTQEVVRRKLLLDETWAETGAVVGTSGPGAKRRWQRAVPRLRREVLARIEELPEDLRRRVLRRIGKDPDARSD